MANLQSKKLAGNKPTAATQKYLDILEIKDDVVVLKDGTIRAVLLVSSINFALKSEEEQNAIIQGYIQFLNSFNFPFQIVIQSRRLDIDEYLDRLKNIEKEQVNELLKIQTTEYRQYIKELVGLADIMSKHFYVIVPYSPGKGERKNFFTQLQEAISPSKIINLKQKKFDKYRNELLKRVDFISDGLSSLGLKVVQLDTQGLIELFYNIYNLETYDQQELKDINKIRIEEE